VVDIGARAAAAPGWVVRLVGELRAFAPDVVHTYLFHAGLASRPVARLFTRSPVVSSVVGVDALRGTAAAAVERLSLRAAKAVLVNARAVEDKLRPHASLSSRLVLQYQGVDVARVAAAPPADRSVVGRGSPVVAVVGRLHPEKAPDVAVDVLAALQPRFPHTRLLLVGGGPLRASLERAAAAKGVAPATTVLGPVSQAEVFGLLKLADVLLVPARTEGLPAVVLEAFAARVPVVATAVGGIPEVVEPERTGLLAPTPDAAELARLCARLFDDDVLRGRMVDAAYERALAFPASDLVTDRARLYRDLAFA
jgi:glycosyltransferase involved in cell wall biosynthesis